MGGCGGGMDAISYFYSLLNKNMIPPFGSIWNLLSVEDIVLYLRTKCRSRKITRKQAREVVLFLYVHHQSSDPT